VIAIERSGEALQEPIQPSMSLATIPGSCRGYPLLRMRSYFCPFRPLIYSHGKFVAVSQFKNPNGPNMKWL